MNKKIILESFKNFINERHSIEPHEKEKQFEDILYGKSKKENIVFDEIVDFSDYMLGSITRWQAFSRYIRDNYSNKKYKKVLDVGCGPIMDLSKELINLGYDVTSMDPRILNPDGIKKLNEYFIYGKTNVEDYDLLVGLEPCQAAEHIMKSGLENNIPFSIALCVAPHDTIKGKKFNTVEDYFKYLIDESKGKAIIEDKKIYTKEFYVLRNK